MLLKLQEMKKIILPILTFVGLFRVIWSYDKEITFSVDPGKIDCFYHLVRVGETIDLEYQVIDGGHGDLDINFEMLEPIGRIIVSDYRKSENVHRYEVAFQGDFKFCFDNRFSTFNKKTIFFELIIENDNSNNNQWNHHLEDSTTEEIYDIKVQDIMDYIGRIRIHMIKAKHIQDMIRSFEARDRNIAEENYLKVNAWSFFQICAMIGVGALQVFMLKSIFNTKESKMQMLWKKIGF